MKKLLRILIPLLLLGLLLAACTDPSPDDTKPANLPDLTAPNGASVDQSGDPVGTSRPDVVPDSGQPDPAPTGQPGDTATDDPVVQTMADPDADPGGIPVEGDVEITVSGEINIGGN